MISFTLEYFLDYNQYSFDTFESLLILTECCKIPVYLELNMWKMFEKYNRLSS